MTGKIKSEKKKREFTVVFAEASGALRMPSALVTCPRNLEDKAVREMLIPLLENYNKKCRQKCQKGQQEWTVENVTVEVDSTKIKVDSLLRTTIASGAHVVVQGPEEENASPIVDSLVENAKYDTLIEKTTTAILEAVRQKSMSEVEVLEKKLKKYQSKKHKLRKELQKNVTAIEATTPPKASRQNAQNWFSQLSEVSDTFQERASLQVAEFKTSANTGIPQIEFSKISDDETIEETQKSVRDKTGAWFSGLFPKEHIPEKKCSAQHEKDTKTKKLPTPSSITSPNTRQSFIARLVNDVISSERPANTKAVRWTSWRVPRTEFLHLQYYSAARNRLEAVINSNAWKGFEVRGGLVSPPPALECGLIDALGEIHDPISGTHRLTKPEVRHTFVQMILDAYMRKIAADKQHHKVKYVGLGSGLALLDLEILAGLRRRGFTIVSVLLVDPLYAGIFDDFADAPTTPHTMSADDTATVRTFFSNDEAPLSSTSKYSLPSDTTQRLASWWSPSNNRSSFFSRDSVGADQYPAHPISRKKTIVQEEAIRRRRRRHALNAALDRLWLRKDDALTTRTRRLLTPRLSLPSFSPRLASLLSGDTDSYEERDDIKLAIDDATIERCGQALTQLADYLTPECKSLRVLSSVEEARAAAAERPEIFGNATLIVACDLDTGILRPPHLNEDDDFEAGEAQGEDDSALLKSAIHALCSGHTTDRALFAHLEDDTDQTRRVGVRLACHAAERTLRKCIDCEDDHGNHHAEHRAMFEVERYWAETRIGKWRSTLEVVGTNGTGILPPRPEDIELKRAASEMRLAKAVYWRNRVQRDEIRISKEEEDDESFKKMYMNSDDDESTRLAVVRLATPATKKGGILAVPARRVLLTCPGNDKLVCLDPRLGPQGRGTRPTELRAIPIAPERLEAVLPSLDDGTEVVVEIPENFNGGWVNVSPGCYWWREALAALAALSAEDIDLKNQITPILNNEKCAWLRVAGPDNRPIKIIHDLGAILRRDLAAESRIIAELSPGEVVEVLELRTTACAKRLKRAKVATLLAPTKMQKRRGAYMTQESRPCAIGWLSVKTLLDLPAHLEPATFDLFDPSQSIGDPPDGDGKPIPPTALIPSATFDVPAGVLPGQTMTVAVPKHINHCGGPNVSGVDGCCDEDDAIIYDVTVPADIKPGAKFKVKLLSPLLATSYHS